MPAAAATAVKSPANRNPELIRYINLKLAALGQPTSRSTADPEFLEIAGPLLRNYHQKDQLLGNRLCPADTRIQSFLDSYLADVAPRGAARLPVDSFALDREGMARIMSLPASADVFASPCLQSYRVAQGVLHNPKSDKRTTQGLFHIAEGGLPVPADKIAVPKQAFAALWEAALHPPASMLVLPFTADQDERVRCFVSLLLRPMVCPAAGRDPEKTMEIRFVAPASLVSNLDFVESIFGNGGDPYLPENDAALDALHWTGHTGCVVLAPHLVGIKKNDIGLPHMSRGHRSPAPRWHVLGKRRRAVQRRDRVQDYLPRSARRDGHHPRRQLLRLLQERSEDADQLRGESVRHVRGRACRRGHRVRHLRARPGILRRPHGQLEEGELLRCDVPAGRSC